MIQIGVGVKPGLIYQRLHRWAAASRETVPRMKLDGGRIEDISRPLARDEKIYKCGNNICVQL